MKKIFILGFSLVVALVATGCGTSTDTNASGDQVKALTETVDVSAFETETLKLSDDTTVTINSLIDGDKPVVLWSWAPWCTNCKAEAPGIDEFAKNNPDVQVIGIGASGDLETAKSFIKETGVTTSAMVWTEEVDVWQSLGFSGRTENLVMAGDLSKRTKPTFRFDEDKVEAAIAELG